MDPAKLAVLLERVRQGALSLEGALDELRKLPFAELGYAKVDHHRALRQGVPEVVLAEGKALEHLVGIVEELATTGQRLLVTRLAPEPAQVLLERVRGLEYHPAARLARSPGPASRRDGLAPVPVVAAGTSDLPVAEEAAESLLACGIDVDRIYDVGVAGLHRLLAQAERLREAPAIVVVAGMEGALPSVVAGLVAAPVVAVPTSVGYGAALGGLTALFGMLTSCASGVTVVNIDNGFGAAMAVVRILSSRGESR